MDIKKSLDSTLEKITSLTTEVSMQNHFNDVLTKFDYLNVVGLFLQGSQNYHLNYKESDVDTKCLVLPTLEDIVLNKIPVSHTFVRKNDEHIDFKDLRLYFALFRKQNINFMEILFTKYFIVNPLYEDSWNRLIKHREAVSHYDPSRTVWSSFGIAKEKMYALEHKFPSRKKYLDLYGYDPKQLHHILRIKDFLEKYIADLPYSDCLIPKDPEYLISVKKQGVGSLEKAREIAKSAMADIETLVKNFPKDSEKDKKVDILLNEIQYDIMMKSIKIEIEADKHIY